MPVNALSGSAGGIMMDNTKKLPRLLSIKEIQEVYFHDIGYKKLKCFLLNYIPYRKIGNTYYFSKKKLDELVESEYSAEYRISTSDYGYNNN